MPAADAVPLPKAGVGVGTADPSYDRETLEPAPPMPAGRRAIRLNDRLQWLGALDFDYPEEYGRHRRALKAILKHCNATTGRCDPAYSGLEDDKGKIDKADASKAARWAESIGRLVRWPSRKAPGSPILQHAFILPSRLKSVGPDTNANGGRVGLSANAEAARVGENGGSRVGENVPLGLVPAPNKHLTVRTPHHKNTEEESSPSAASLFERESAEGSWALPLPSATLASTTARSASGQRYAFEGKIIRLTEADFERWRGLYSAIPDLRAQLESDDAWYDANLAGKERKQWFYRLCQKLNKLHQDLLAKQRSEGRASTARTEKSRTVLQAGTPEAMAAYDE